MLSKLMKVDATSFIEKLKTFQSREELLKYQRYFKFAAADQSADDHFIGVRMGQVFELAKEFIDMPPHEIEKLLESPIHEARAGACSIMDKKARAKNTSESERKELFELYMRRHDRVNNWDLVDLGCLHLIGSYLLDKPRDILYELARSENQWERRTAIVGTAYLIRKGATEDTFKIAEILVNDKEDLVHKGTGWMLRFAGDKDREKLLGFLDEHAATMPRTLLRYSIEKLDKAQRDHYLNLKRAL